MQGYGKVILLRVTPPTARRADNHCNIDHSLAFKAYDHSPQRLLAFTCCAVPMLTLQYNMGGSAERLDALLSSVLTTPASILVLQECSPLGDLEMANWLVSRSSPSMDLHDRNRLFARAAVAVNQDLHRHVRGFRHTATHVAGIRLVDLPGYAGDVLIFSVYLPPDALVPLRLRTFNTAFADIQAMMDECDRPTAVLIGGDFNTPSGPWAPEYAPQSSTASRAISEPLIDWMEAHDFACFTPPDTVTRSTHRHRGSTLDLTFGSAEVSQYRLWDWENRADHLAITYLLSSGSEHDAAQARPPHPFSLTGVQWDFFPKALHRHLTKHAEQLPPVSTWERARTALPEALAECRSLRTRANTRSRRRPKRNAWAWTPECDSTMKARNRIFQRLNAALPPPPPNVARAAQIKSHPDYKSAHRSFRSARRKAKNAAMQAAVGNISSTEEWKRFEILMQRRPHLVCASPALRDGTGTLHQSAEHKCLLLARHLFPDCEPAAAPQQMSSSTAVTTPPLATTSSSSPDLAAGALLEPASLPELRAVIDSIEKGRAAGPDGIGPDLLKRAFNSCDTFRDLLLNLVNDCLTRGIFPTHWRHALVTIISKHGQRDPSLPSSYRPISLLCVASKATESLVKMRLQWSLEQRDMLRYQYTTVPGISTIHALVTLIQKGRDAVALKREAALISIDVGGAFNQINHSALTQHIRDLGLPAMANWIQSWLTARTCAIRLDGHTSSAFNLGTRGIPQGSPLSPLLWCLYLDSFFQQVRTATESGEWETGAYMDDLFVLVVADTKPALLRTAQRWLDTLATWCAERHLSLDKPSFLFATAMAAAHVDDTAPADPPGAPDTIPTAGDGGTTTPNATEVATGNDDEVALPDGVSAPAVRPIGVLPPLAPADDTYSLRLPGGERLLPTSSTVRVLGVDIGTGFNSQEHIRRKSASARSLAQRLRWAMRDVGDVSLPTRLKLAKMYILPVLDYGSPLHSRMRTSKDETHVTRADKDIFSFVLNVPATSSFPSAVAMAHELGQLRTTTRWRLQTLSFGVRVQLHHSHSSSVYARDLLSSLHASQQVEESRETELSTFGPGDLSTPSSAETRVAVLNAPKLGPLRLVGRTLPLHPLEQISKQPTPPWQWLPLDINILDRERAKKTEKLLSASNQKFAARVYTDGSFTPAMPSARPPQQALLGSAALLLSSAPNTRLQSVEGLHADRWGILEAELYALLLGLRLCHPPAGSRGWNRIDIFSDSQSSLQRLACPWHRDSRALQHLTIQIRAEVESLRAQFDIPIRFWWVPGHESVPGNEQADRLAAEAASLPPRAPPPPHSASKAFQWNREAMMKLEQATWPKLASGSLLSISPIFASDNLKTYSGLSWRLTWTLIKFRSCTLPVANHRQCQPGDPLARCLCDATWQDREHLLLHCPLIAEPRHFVQRHLEPTDRACVDKLLAGGGLPDNNRRSQYLIDLERFLNACMRILRKTCVANGVFARDDGDLHTSNTRRRLMAGDVTFLPDTPPFAGTPSPPPATPSPIAPRTGGRFTFLPDSPPNLSGVTPQRLPARPANSFPTPGGGSNAGILARLADGPLVFQPSRRTPPQAHPSQPPASSAPTSILQRLTASGSLTFLPSNVTAPSAILTRHPDSATPSDVTSQSPLYLAALDLHSDSEDDSDSYSDLDSAAVPGHAETEPRPQPTPALGHRRRRFRPSNAQALTSIAPTQTQTATTNAVTTPNAADDVGEQPDVLDLDGEPTLNPAITIIADIDGDDIILPDDTDVV